MQEKTLLLLPFHVLGIYIVKTSPDSPTEELWETLWISL